MNKKNMKQLPVEQFPTSLELSQFTEVLKYEYVFSVKKHKAGKDVVLAVTFFSVETRSASFRVFFTKKDFVTEMLAPEIRWSAATLGRLIPAACVIKDNRYVWHMCALCVSEKSKKLICNFFGKSNEAPLSVLHNFQAGVRNAQLEARHAKTRKRTETVMRQVKALPKGVITWANRNLLPSYIYYRRSGKTVCGYCTACGSEVRMANGRHNEKGVCPECKKKVVFKAEGRARRVYDESAFSVVQKVNDGVAIRFFTIFKKYGDDYRNPKISYLEVERRFFQKDKSIQYCFDARYAEKWRISRSKLGVRDYFVYPRTLDNALKGTQWQYCGLKAYLNYDPTTDVSDYMTTYCEMPVLELLVKMELYRLAEELIYPGEERQIFKVLNFSGKNFFGVFSVGKETLAILRKYNASSSLLRFIQLIYSQYGYCRSEHLDAYFAVKSIGEYYLGTFIDRVAEVQHFTTYTKAINYVMKQCGRTTIDKAFLNTLGNWLDYLKHARLLDYDVKNEFTLFPKKLKKEHDRAAREYAENKTEINEAKISAMAEALNLEFMFESNGYILRAPNTVKEIREEGEALKHCVGGYYVDEMAAGLSVLLFIREAERPDAPFFTAQYKSGRIVQCRGFANCDMTPEVKGFVDKWLAVRAKRKKLRVTA